MRSAVTRATPGDSAAGLSVFHRSVVHALPLVCLLWVGCSSSVHTPAGAGGLGADNVGGGGSGKSGGASGAAAGSGGHAATAGKSGGDAGKGAGGNASAGHDSGGAGHAAGSGAATTGTIKLVPNIVSGTHTSTSNGSAGIGSSQSFLRIGSPSATTLYSLKYYVTSIQLCEDLTLAGSGFSNASGCISLYQNQNAGSPDYVTYTVAEAEADTTPGRYIDLMDPADQATLRQPVTLQVPIAAADPGPDDAADGGVDDAPSQAGVYRYGLINFYRPIKVRADFPIVGEVGNYFRTKAVTEILPDPMTPGMLSGERVQIGDTLSGATEETTYMLNNGGAIFVFQKPFAITQADVDAQAEIKVDLVFNPENFGQAYQSQCTNDAHTSVCDPLNNVAIDMPYVRMNPVPRKSGEHTRKETYLIDYESSSKLRIELYYNDADPEAGIQGVDTAIVYDASAAMANSPSGNVIASNFISQRGSVTSSDASVTLMDYQHISNLSGLLRRQAGSVTIHCQFTGSFCPMLGADVEKAYTYVGDSLVSSD